MVEFQLRSTEHIPIAIFDQLDQPSYYRFQTLGLSDTRGQLVAYRLTVLLLYFCVSFFKRSPVCRYGTVCRRPTV
jgi:hypothetical protein